MKEQEIEWFAETLQRELGAGFEVLTEQELHRRIDALERELGDRFTARDDGVGIAVCHESGPVGAVTCDALRTPDGVKAASAYFRRVALI